MKMNNLKSLINSGRIYFGGFLFVCLIFCILLLKQHLLLDQAVFFRKCYIVSFDLDFLVVLVLFSQSFQVTLTLVSTIFKGKLF